jgi:hypothetical protein
MIWNTLTKSIHERVSLAGMRGSPFPAREGLPCREGSISHACKGDPLMPGSSSSIFLLYNNPFRYCFSIVGSNDFCQINTG